MVPAVPITFSLLVMIAHVPERTYRLSSTSRVWTSDCHPAGISIQLIWTFFAPVVT
jgi:hypothetical protein